ncbi:MAG: hypothetical protein RSC48_08030 [Anaerorhabdus sp.]
MIKSTIEKRRVISLTIHGESGQLELPEFGKNECFVVIERGGSICAYEHRPYVCAKYSYDNVLSSSKAEESTLQHFGLENNNMYLHNKICDI